MPVSIMFNYICYFLFLPPSFPPFPALSGVTVVTFPRLCLLHFWLLRLSLHLWGFLLGQDVGSDAKVGASGAMGLMPQLSWGSKTTSPEG